MVNYWLFALLAIVPISIGSFGFSIVTKIICLICLLPGVIQGSYRHSTKIPVMVFVATIMSGSFVAYYKGQSDYSSYFIDLFFGVCLIFSLRMPGGRYTPPSIDVISKFVAWSILVNFVFVFVDYLIGKPMFSVEYEGSRFNGTLGPPGSAIYYLGCFIVFSAAYVIRGGFEKVVLCIIMLVLIVLTETRIVLATTFVYMVALIRVMNASRSKSVLIFFATIFGMVGWVFLLSRLLFSDSEYLSIADFLDSIDTSGRNYIWEVLWEKFESEGGVFGFGLGSAAAFLNLQAISEIIALQPHNDYLRVLFNLGWIPCLAYFFAYFSVCGKFIGVFGAKLNAGNVYKFLASSFFLCMLIIMITDNVIIYHFYFYPMTIFLAMAYCISESY